MTAILKHDLTWRALADPVCRGILDFLKGGSRTTTEICGAFENLSRFKVMNHMASLKDAGLIRVEERGRERINSLDTAPLRAVFDDWMHEYEAIWAGRLNRLKISVEAKQEEKTMNVQTLERGQLVPLDIKFDVLIKAPAAAVFLGLTEDIGAWWGAPYLQNEAATDLILEARPGGLMVERSTGSDGAIWGIVQEIRRDKFIAIEGRMHMGPAVFARTIFELVEENRQTRLLFSTSAFGTFNESHREIFAGGLRDLLDVRLRAFVEQGEASGLRGAASHRTTGTGKTK